MCQVLNVSKSGYYKWTKRTPSTRDKENEVMLTKIKAIFKKHKGRYGSPRITRELKKNGDTCNKKRVAHIMRDNHLKAKARRKFKATTNSKHDYQIAPNLLNQDFKVDVANKVWVGDITYIWTKEGWLYLEPVRSSVMT